MEALLSIEKVCLDFFKEVWFRSFWSLSSCSSNNSPFKFVVEIYGDNVACDG